MAFQTIFKRYEFKYIITLDQKQKILSAMQDRMALDRYGRSTIRNIYFDTDNYRLIRHSIEKPAYKEKLRIRSYTKADAQTTVFVELKKKYKHIVYKRRISMPEQQAMDWVCGNSPSCCNTQISNEIDYFIQYYENLYPVVFLSYEREAYYALDGSDFRITFDDNILCREYDISLESEIYGEKILSDGKILMELKCSGGIPMWLTRILSQEKIYKTSFSKYGTAYASFIFSKQK